MNRIRETHALLKLAFALALAGGYGLGKWIGVWRARRGTSAPGARTGPTVSRPYAISTRHRACFVPAIRRELEGPRYPCMERRCTAASRAKSRILYTRIRSALEAGRRDFFAKSARKSLPEERQEEPCELHPVRQPNHPDQVAEEDTAHQGRVPPLRSSRVRISFTTRTSAPSPFSAVSTALIAVAASVAFCSTACMRSSWFSN